MLREEVKYASKDYVNYLLDKQEYHNEKYTDYDIKQAFEKGAEWADKHHNLESLWHDAGEEPEIHKMFLAQIGDDVFETFVMYVDKNQYWKNWSNDVNIKMLAYIDDLLPKGGKK